MSPAARTAQFSRMGGRCGAGLAGADVAAVTLQTRVICAAAGAGRISFGLCPPVSVLLAGQRRGLADHLALVSDPRDVRGVRHTLTSLLLAAVAVVVLAGTRSFTAAGEWVADGPPQVVASLEYAVIR